MTGKTHAAGGAAMALGGFMLLDKYDCLIPGLNQFIQLGIILPYAVWSSTVPDLDKHNKNKVDVNPVDSVIEKFFMIIKAGHRSAKSHIYPVILFGVLIVMTFLGKAFFQLNAASTNVLLLMEVGVFVGLLSHMILDMCTTDGLRVLGKRVAIVPEVEIFRTGSLYEDIFRRICYVISCILLALIIFI